MATAEYHREYYARNKSKRGAQIRAAANRSRLQRQADLREYLSDKSCQDCKLSDWRVLTFDHLRDKRNNVSNMVVNGYSWAAILDEIEKCEIVCANCHHLRTAKRGGWWRAVEA